MIYYVSQGGRYVLLLKDEEERNFDQNKTAIFKNGGQQFITWLYLANQTDRQSHHRKPIKNPLKDGRSGREEMKEGRRREERKEDRGGWRFPLFFALGL